MVKKVNKSGLKYYVVIGVLGVFTVGGLIFAYVGGSPDKVIENIEVYNEAEQTQDFNLGAQGGTDLTVDNLTYGSSRSVRLSFNEGATSTPGELFAIPNYGPTKVCNTIQLDLTKNNTTGGLLGTGIPLSFSITTSTGVNVGNGANLVATTTVATGTVALLDNIVYPGTYAGGDQDIGGKSWLWESGKWIIGTYSVLSGSPATSTVYDMAGNVYIDCHERN